MGGGRKWAKPDDGRPLDGRVRPRGFNNHVQHLRANRWGGGDTDRFLIRQEGVADMGYHQLTRGERYTIARMRARGHSGREIARCLGRSASTIRPELRRKEDTYDNG